MISKNGEQTKGVYRGGLPVVRAYHGTLLIFDSTGGTRLPSEYQKVEYIKFTGNQYVYLNHYPTQETKLEISLTPTATRGAWSSNSGSGLSNNFTGYVGTSSSNCRFGNKTVAITTALNKKHLIVQSKDGLYLDGELEGRYTGVNDFESSAELRIGYNTNYYLGNVEYFRLWEDGVLIRDCVPCYRKSDTEAGFYDLVHDVFYPSSTNSGLVDGPAVA